MYWLYTDSDNVSALSITETYSAASQRQLSEDSECRNVDFLHFSCFYIPSTIRYQFKKRLAWIRIIFTNCILLGTHHSLHIRYPDAQFTNGEALGRL